MSPEILGVVHNGAIEVPEGVNLPEGCQVIVTPLSAAQDEFWVAASGQSLANVWDNAEDDAYAQLL